MRRIKSSPLVIAVILVSFGLSACREDRQAGKEARDERPVIRHPGFKQEDLWRAIKINKQGGVARLLEDGADVNAKTSDGENALILAVKNNRRNIVRLILDRSRVDINESNDDGMSALMYAVHPGPDEKKHLESLVKPEGSWLTSEILVSEEDYRPISTAKELLRAGADPNRPDATGRTAIMHANTEEKIRLVVSYGADIDAQDKEGMTALVHAALDCNPEAASTLIALGADVKSVDVIGYLEEEESKLKELLNDEEGRRSRSAEEMQRRFRAMRKLKCWEYIEMKAVLNGARS